MIILGSEIGSTAGFNQVLFTDLDAKTFSLKWDENSNQNVPELQERVDILKYYVHYMEENLADSMTFLPGMEMKRTGQKSRVPQLKLWNRTEAYIAMELGNMVQVNHMSDHVKVVIWHYEGRLMLTIINHMSSQTFSLGTSCPHYIRTRLETTLEEVKRLARKLSS